LNNLEYVDRLDAAVGSLTVRKEVSSQRAIYYALDGPALERAAESVPRETVIMRRSNLEDLFLRATGRHLNAEQ
jgi:hypothetical protein